jgi:hypothetical protein
VPTGNQKCLRAFLGSNFAGLLSSSPPKSHVGPKGKKRNWGMSREFPVHTPVPNSEFPSLFPPMSLPFFRLGPSPFPSNPLPSRPSQPISPIPSSTSLSHPPPSSPFPAHTSVGWGAWGAGPLSSQAAAAVVAAGCVSLCRGVGAKGATGFRGVLAPADGGEVGARGWAHSCRNGGGLSPQHPPSLPSCYLSGLGLLLPLSPPPLPNAC